MEDMTNTF